MNRTQRPHYLNDRPVEITNLHADWSRTFERLATYAFWYALLAHFTKHRKLVALSSVIGLTALAYPMIPQSSTRFMIVPRNARLTL